MGNKVLFSGYYGFDNSGDDAILHAIVNDIRAIDPALQLNVLSYDPARTRRLYGVNATQRFHYASVKKAIRASDLLVSGGGSLLQDETSSRSLYYYLGVMALAKRLNKKIYVYANGVGPIHKSLNRKLTAKVLNEVDCITLRDEDSLRVLKEIGVTKPPIEVTADPVYGIEGITREAALALLREERIPTDRRFLGVAVRQWKKAPALAKKIAYVADRIYEELNLDILFTPLHYPEDKHFADSIKAAMVHRSHAHVLAGNYDVGEMEGFIGLCDVAIAMRLHALIYAVTSKTPAVGIVYDPKVKSQLEALGMPSDIQAEGMDEKRLLNAVIDVYKNREAETFKLKAMHDRLLEKSRRNVQYVFDLLER
ncbi:MAG: polysaccharide pyruvyl transferase CsaB [Peptoniphilus sp.]|nr:polysaccharide pyruvyl transferase CsaB [Peptoniphilus sp.]MDD7362571.1 polysaccharide pyruvyl transferase CsaB [Bacillota bacterium]MDY6045030.1 polysaccharide pyruvyl transferase CsaB [Peptoniphilus sp.]